MRHLFAVLITLVAMNSERQKNHFQLTGFFDANV